MIFVLSNKEASTVAKRAEASNSGSVDRLATRNATLPQDVVLLPSPLHQIGVFERFYRNSNREKSKGGLTRCPAILVANGTCMTKAAPINLLLPAWPKAGRCT